MDTVGTETAAGETVVLGAPKDVVRATWDELGYQIRPLFAKVFVRTELPPLKTESGLLWLPPKEAHFFSGLGHQRLVMATVLSVGPGVKSVKVGERVCFQRLHFGHIKQLDDKTFFGWLECEQIAGYPEDDTVGPMKA
jgi:co-chaperonin GroES (HSP10)